MAGFGDRSCADATVAGIGGSSVGAPKAARLPSDCDVVCLNILADYCPRWTSNKQLCLVTTRPWAEVDADNAIQVLVALSSVRGTHVRPQASPYNGHCICTCRIIALLAASPATAASPARAAAAADASPALFRRMNLRNRRHFDDGHRSRSAARERCACAPFV
jgi:hypothetical protein